MPEQLYAVAALGKACGLTQPGTYEALRAHGCVVHGTTIPTVLATRRGWLVEVELQHGDGAPYKTSRVTRYGMAELPDVLTADPRTHTSNAPTWAKAVRAHRPPRPTLAPERLTRVPETLVIVPLPPEGDGALCSTRAGEPYPGCCAELAWGERCDEPTDACDSFWDEVEPGVAVGFGKPDIAALFWSEEQK